MKTKLRCNKHSFWAGWVIPICAWLALIIALMFTGGCSTLEFGAGYSPAALGGEEVKLNNPIGYVGGTTRWFEDGELSVDTFVRHYSGMLQQETGGGFNVVGVKATIDFDKIGR